MPLTETSSLSSLPSGTSPSALQLPGALSQLSLPSTTVILPKKTYTKPTSTAVPKIITIAPQNSGQLLSHTASRSTAPPTNHHQEYSRPAAKLSMKGRQVTVDGELGVFIPNSVVSPESLIS